MSIYYVFNLYGLCFQTSTRSTRTIKKSKRVYRKHVLKINLELKYTNPFTF